MKALRGELDKADEKVHGIAQKNRHSDFCILLIRVYVCLGFLCWFCFLF